MKKYMFIAAATLALTACSNDENLLNDSNEPVEIHLSSSLQVQSRATHDLDTQIEENEIITVWVDENDNNTNSELYNDILQVSKGGALGSTTGTTMYFPSSGNPVNIYAIHGNLDDYTTFWDTKQTHTVYTDQTTNTSNGYAVSDLVYCKSTNVARTKSTIPLNFNHLLSKVEVVLLQGAGVPGICKVEITNAQKSTEFTPVKGSDWTVKAAGELCDIIIDHDITATADKETNPAINEAVIVPQTLAAGTEFIKVTTDKGGTLVYKLPNETEFKSNYCYRYIITANLTEMTVSATINPWNPADTETGNAAMD